MAVLLAWRMLTDDARRSVLAVLGVLVAIVLVFFQLGLFLSVPRGGLLLYDHLRFDLMMTSSQYQYGTNSGVFPRSRLALLRNHPIVATVTPLHFAGAKWQTGIGGKWLDVFLIGFSTATSPFVVGGINRQLNVLDRPDMVLVDDSTGAMFGPLTVGRIIGLEARPETIGGTYHLGTGFMGLGVVLLSEENFERLFPMRGRNYLNLAPIVLKSGANSNQAADALRNVLPTDIHIYTRQQIEAEEVAYWTTRSAVGLIFGSGLVIAIVVGVMIIYATLAVQINRHLRQFATLTAIGHTEHELYAIVFVMACMIIATGFIAAVPITLFLYSVIRGMTMLPVMMTEARFAAVLSISFAMATISALFSAAALRQSIQPMYFD